MGLEQSQKEQMNAEMNKFTIKDSHMHFDNSQMYLEKIKNKQGNECIHQQGFTDVF